MKKEERHRPEEIPDREPPPFEQTRMALIAGSTVPVRPLFSPFLRTSILMGISLVVGGLALLFTRLRPDLKTVSWSITYGPTTLKLVLGAVAFWMAMRWSVPGAGATYVRSSTIIGVALILVLALAMVAPTFVEADHQRFLVGMRLDQGFPCMAWEIAVALPVFLFAVWLILRGAVTAFLLAGALAGLGAGLVADAAIHLHCPSVALAHTIPKHLGAVFLLTAAGALAGKLLPKW